MNSVRVPAYAKVNLRLEILGRRADGYHELRTIFQSLTLHDTLTLEIKRKPGIELRITGNSQLAGEPGPDNLVYRAIRDLSQALIGFRRGVRAVLDKRIPVGRGLGGGSSDAAAALIGLLRLTRKTHRWRAPHGNRLRTRRGRSLFSARRARPGHRPRR